MQFTERDLINILQEINIMLMRKVLLTRKSWRKVSVMCWTGIWLLTGAVGSGSSLAEEAGVEWPDEWIVFAPLDRLHRVEDESVWAAVPEILEIPETDSFPAKSLGAQRIPVIPGKPVDLSDAMEDTAVGTTAYVFIELQSSQRQDVTLGLGGDWWMECRLNGEPFFDTLETGGGDRPFGILDHKVDVELQEGENILAIRFSRGKYSALLAAGDEQHFAAEKERLQEKRRRRGLNILPENFEDRLLFPVEEQAVATAGKHIDLSLPDVNWRKGELAGEQSMPNRQLYVHNPSGRRAEVRDTLLRRFDDPVTIRLSKSRYPYEDRHLDAIVWTTTAEEHQTPTGHIKVHLKDAYGALMSENIVETLSPSGLFFSVGLPPGLEGAEGELEVIWRDGDEEIGRSAKRFHVNKASGVQEAGRITLKVLNDPGAKINNAPMTVGVPFPQGVLSEESNVRLVDEEGAELPLQTRVTARWSRFGSVKWLLCDFLADLDGESRNYYLEYGPDIERRSAEMMQVTDADEGFPSLHAGRIRVGENGIEHDAEGNGVFQAVFGEDALHGAFVTHENGRKFTVPADREHVVEETGSEKTVVRRTGWYVHEQSAKEFCQFVTRFVFHRDSPVVRIFHTWIFTGDGSRDRIADMGWRFETAHAMEDARLLTSFQNGQWQPERSLVQYDYQNYMLIADGTEYYVKGRTPGVFSAEIGDSRVVFGAKDFWQNFPSELETEDHGFTFYNWPRNNPPATFERPVPPSQAFLHRFAHEGELLDFRLPDEYAEGTIWNAACSYERHWAEGKPESANAQGIARTEEMFLYLAGTDESMDNAVRVMRGLNDESLRAVVDPAWMAQSDVFGPLHPYDPQSYPEDEHLYEQIVDAPSRWNERLGFYGMWLHGDLPAWSIGLQRRHASLYRTIRKNHHGWPQTWIPFIRSGSPRQLKHAEAATRQMLDANFCHYATEDVDASVGANHYRRQGWWDRSLLPWAGRCGPHRRSYTVDCDYIWHAYYLTGYTRARDVALLFGELTQEDHRTLSTSRTTESVLPSYLKMYQATFNPWFLAASQDVARLHELSFDREEIVDTLTHDVVGSNWRQAYEDYYRFTGDDVHYRITLNNAISYCSPNTYGYLHRWDFLSFPYIRRAAFAWSETGDDFYLRRLSGYLNWVQRVVYDGEVEYGRGAMAQSATARGIFTGYYLRNFPFALGAFESAGYRPDPLPDPLYVMGDRVRADDQEYYRFRLPEILIQKEKDAGPIVFSLAHRHGATTRDHLTYIYELSSLPHGDVLVEGKWPSDRSLRKEKIPAEAAAGVYRLSYGGYKPREVAEKYLARRLRRIQWIRLPATDPDVPEVVRLEHSDDGTRVPAGYPEVLYWFKVPENTGEFWIEFPNTRSDRFNRVSVWNPDHERVFDRSHEGADGPGRIAISVPPQDAGKIWGASSAMGGFILDPVISPYISLTQQKWFAPEQE